MNMDGINALIEMDRGGSGVGGIFSLLAFAFMVYLLWVIVPAVLQRFKDAGLYTAFWICVVIGL
jgi:hypothetical protein